MSEALGGGLFLLTIGVVACIVRFIQWSATSRRQGDQLARADQYRRDIPQQEQELRGRR